MPSAIIDNNPLFHKHVCKGGGSKNDWFLWNVMTKGHLTSAPPQSQSIPKYICQGYALKQNEMIDVSLLFCCGLGQVPDPVWSPAYTIRLVHRKTTKDHCYCKISFFLFVDHFVFRCHHTPPWWQTEMSDSESAKKNRFEGASSLSEPEQINKSMKQDPPLWPLSSHWGPSQVISLQHSTLPSTSQIFSGVRNW